MKCWCTRCREVKGQSIVNPKLIIRKYRASGGTEYFLEYVNGDDMYTLYGFLRLRISDPGSKTIYRELICKGLIRELHIYGKVLDVHKTEKSASQHKGLGENFKTSRINFKKTRYVGVSIISGIGFVNIVTDYKPSDGGYMIKEFANYKPVFGLLMVLLWIYIYVSTLPLNPTS